MQMVRWMCVVSMKDRRTSEELRKLVGVELIATVIRSGTLSWYRYMMRKGDEDWVKKCMEYREGWTTKKNMFRECRSGYGRT